MNPLPEVMLTLTSLETSAEEVVADIYESSLLINPCAKLSYNSFKSLVPVVFVIVYHQYFIFRVIAVMNHVFLDISVVMSLYLL